MSEIGNLRLRSLWVEDPACLSPSRLLCSIDPLSAAVGGVIPALFGAFGGGGKSEAPAPAPATPPPPAAPPKSPAPKQNNVNAPGTFIGSVPTPPPATGGKTLLGT